MTQASCPICQGEARFDLYHPDADLYRCCACDHCFSHLETLRRTESYQADYFQEVHSNWFSFPHEEMYSMLLKGMQKYQAQGGTVLDVGCGNAKFLKFLRSRVDWELTGIDLSEQKPVEGLNLIQADFHDFRPPMRFDIVTSIMVVEHVENPQEHLKGLLNCCRPGGLLVVLTINERSVLYLTARLLRYFGYSAPFQRLYSIHHLNHFNSRSLETWLGKETEVLEHLHHNVPMGAVDIPSAPGPRRLIQWLGVWLTFLLGRLTSRTYAQTVFARTPERI